MTIIDGSKLTKVQDLRSTLSDAIVPVDLHTQSEDAFSKETTLRTIKD